MNIDPSRVIKIQDKYFIKVKTGRTYTLLEVVQVNNTWKLKG